MPKQTDLSNAKYFVASEGDNPTMIFFDQLDAFISGFYRGFLKRKLVQTRNFMRIAPKETSIYPLGWRCLSGPAMILDGVIGILTSGKVIGGFTLAVARNLAFSRMKQRAKLINVELA